LNNEKEDFLREIVSVKSNATIREAIEVLARNKILAVPVRDTDEVRYIGWFGVLDALSYILKTYSEGEITKGEAAWSSWCKDIDTLTHRGRELGKTTVEVAMNKVWIPPVNATGSVFQLAESIFASPKKEGIHRIGVCNDENDAYVRAIVTQSDVIQFLYNHAQKKPILGDFANTPIGKIDGIRKYAESDCLISMSINAQTIHAFWLMNFDKVYGIPIVDHEGRLVANLSASDIKGISGGELPFSALLLPIRQFIQKAHLKPPLKCSWETSFFNIIQQLALFRVHRIWVVDTQDKPVGVVTLTTIMNFLKDLAK